MSVSGSREVRGGVLRKSAHRGADRRNSRAGGAGSGERGGLIVRDAAELRVKETDRIATIAENFRRMGLKIEVREDGFEVPGQQRFHAAELDSFGDHRIAMAFSVAALVARRPSTSGRRGSSSRVFPRVFRYTTSSHGVNRYGGC